jgi:tetratricopeptide (TPR) repeat protein
LNLRSLGLGAPNVDPARSVPESSPTYWAFLSYSSHDRGTAIWLQRALETYRLPRRLVGRATPAGPAPRRFRPIFRDGTELAADPDLVAQITSALQQSAYLIVICSPHAAQSHWVNEEIGRFRELHGEARILSLIVAGNPKSGEQSCFPPALHHPSVPTHGPQRLEPIAADLRRHGDGPRMARLKLVAGMLGVGLDELVRRDTQRRVRQLITITAASLVGLLVAGALATAAFIARNEAQRQRAHAEGLIEFMLTDLRKRLEPSGRLDAMDGVGREALKYYEAQKPVDLDSQSLSRRARALRLMGEIGVQRGDLSDALRGFEQASATTGELLSRSPSDGQSVFNHAQSVFWVGEIAHQRGDTAKAELSFQEYRRLATQLVVIDPNNDDWRAEVAYAESALGALFLQMGRAADATDSFGRSLAVAEDLARRKPGDLNLQLDLGQGHAWLADALQRSSRLAQARVHSETELQIYRAILAKDGTIRQAKFSTIDVLQSLGELAMLEGDQKEALVNFKDSAERAEALLVGERDNMNLTGVVALAQVSLGEALLADGQVDAARAAQRRADLLLTAVLAHDDTVANWRNYRDRATMLDAKICARNGQTAEALRLDQTVLHRLSTTAQFSANTDPFWLLERSRLQTGDDLAALGRSQEAREEWNAIVKSLPDSVEHYEPRLIEALAQAETRLGRTADAQVITKRLRDLSRPAGG